MQRRYPYTALKRYIKVLGQLICSVKNLIFRVLKLEKPLLPASDGQQMKITNSDQANQFVKRAYRSGWKL